MDLSKVNAQKHDIDLDKSKEAAVNHPAHYRSEAGIEVIDVIEAFGLNFTLGNTVKYILRAGRKDPKKELEDLKKARWYLEREINEKEDKTLQKAAGKE